jgi:hypothetical protein
MKIDEKINKMSKSRRYIKAQKYARALKSNQALVIVEDPKNMGKQIQIRRTSQLGKNYLKTYEDLLSEYNEEFNKLEKLRTNYKSTLFR